jgi:hypothetical protein
VGHGLLYLLLGAVFGWALRGGLAAFALGTHKAVWRAY